MVGEHGGINAFLFSILKRINDFLELEALLKKTFGKECPTVPIKREADVNKSNSIYYG